MPVALVFVSKSANQSENSSFDQHPTFLWGGRIVILRDDEGNQTRLNDRASKDRATSGIETMNQRRLFDRLVCIICKPLFRSVR